MENLNCRGCGFICLSGIICSVIDCNKISKFFRSGRTSGNDNHVLTEYSSNQCSANRRNHPHDVAYIDSRIFQAKMDIDGKCQTDGDDDVQGSKRTKNFSTSSNPGNNLDLMNHPNRGQHRNSVDNQNNKDFRPVLRFLILSDLTATVYNYPQTFESIACNIGKWDLRSTFHRNMCLIENRPRSIVRCQHFVRIANWIFTCKYSQIMQQHVQYYFTHNDIMVRSNYKFA